MSFIKNPKGISPEDAIASIKRYSKSLEDKSSLDELLAKIGDAKIVMLGEASHGTHEYYVWRSYITQKLIEENHFDFIAVEGDWPDCYNINRYIKGECQPGTTATDVLAKFDRWPTWMWANWEIASLSEWLFTYNTKREKKIGFYGLDVYSLWESLESIRTYLEKHEPESLKKTTQTFRCFEPYKDDETSYAYASRLVPELCENEVMELLREIQNRFPGNQLKDEQIFSTEQNAVIAVNAEKYYRAMIKSDADSWNIRDSHMQETLERLLDFHGPDAKAIIWAHNTHVGDASATDMADEGMYNIGELARRAFPGKTFLIGFGSYNGSVIAGSGWGAKMQTMLVPDGRKGSWEYLLHNSGKENKWLIMDDLRNSPLNESHIDHRAIGVVYLPEYERFGNYVPSILPARYDAFIYLDQTRALHPLPISYDPSNVPETYPFGL